jgi:hypothetical protein
VMNMNFNHSTHKMEKVMKNTFNSSVTALIVAVTTVLIAVCAQAATTQTVWTFDSNDTPAVPVGGPLGSSVQAVFVPGEFSMGWLSGSPLFGAGSGLWDLGREGTITVENMTALLGEPTVSRTFSVRVVQWVDSGIYTVPAQVSIPGAVRISRTDSPLGPVTEGSAGATGWIIEETQWRVPPGVVAGALKVTSAHDGSIIDSLAIEAAPAAPVDLILSIQPAAGDPGSIELSWPESAGSATIESFNPAASTDWSPLVTAPSVVGGRYQVTVRAGDAAQLFRLRR